MAWTHGHAERTSGVGTGYCMQCRDKWPCEFVRLEAKYAACRKRSKQLVAERDMALTRLDAHVAVCPVMSGIDPRTIIEEGQQ